MPISVAEFLGAIAKKMCTAVKQKKITISDKFLVIRPIGIEVVHSKLESQEQFVGFKLFGNSGNQGVK